MNNESLLAPEMHQAQGPLINQHGGGARAVAEALFPGLEWTDEVTAHCPCPGQDKHTGKNGPRDCLVKIDGIPTVYCVHQSCKEEIEAANKALRSGVPGNCLPELTHEEKLAQKVARDKAAQKHSLALKAKNSVGQILRDYSWAYGQIIEASQFPIATAPREVMVEAFLSLFQPEDVLWIGDVADSGKPKHATNFRTAREWLDQSTVSAPFGPLTCPSSFVAGSFSRAKDSVRQQHYLVVESDSHTKDQVGSIFRWLDEAVKLPLQAVVDTAGKSLHGWFDFPAPNILEELKVMLPAMGCDPKMFGSSQPCRLPGGLRDGNKIQKLIYYKNAG